MANEPAERLYAEAIDALAELVRRAAHPKRRTISVSPEVAALLSAAVQPQSQPPSEGSGALEALALEVANCNRCGLCATRKQTVFGSGNPNARLLFVGEAPGADEDEQGLPFVGRAGQLLTDIIEKGIGLPRGDVYICNVLKCRPPNNRDPLPEEASSCEPFLKRQLELIKPEFIIALGTHAAHRLLKTDIPVGRLRGVWHYYQGVPVRVTYHPAYLLRTPGDKAKTWEDVKQVIRAYRGEQAPERDPRSIVA